MENNIIAKIFVGVVVGLIVSFILNGITISKLNRSEAEVSRLQNKVDTLQDDVIVMSKNQLSSQDIEKIKSYCAEEAKSVKIQDYDDLREIVYKCDKKIDRVKEDIDDLEEDLEDLEDEI